MIIRTKRLTVYVGFGLRYGPIVYLLRPNKLADCYCLRHLKHWKEAEKGCPCLKKMVNPEDYMSEEDYNKLKEKYIKEGYKNEILKV